MGISSTLEQLITLWSTDKIELIWFMD